LVAVATVLTGHIFTYEESDGRMKIFETIIFDCDGVLINSEIIANRIEVEVKNELEFHISLNEQLIRFVGLGMSHPLVIAELQRLYLDDIHGFLEGLKLRLGKAVVPGHLIHKKDGLVILNIGLCSRGASLFIFL